jgi:hypothetical protein
VIDAIDFAFQIDLPRSRDKLRQLANVFTRFTGGELFGCVSVFYALSSLKCFSKRVLSRRWNSPSGALALTSPDAGGG